MSDISTCNSFFDTHFENVKDGYSIQWQIRKTGCEYKPLAIAKIFSKFNQTKFANIVTDDIHNFEPVSLLVREIGILIWLL